jgi:hypothetical protein
MCASRELFPPFVLEQGFGAKSIGARGRASREVDSFGCRLRSLARSGRLERSASRFVPEPWARWAALTGDEEKAIEALGNPDSGFAETT